MKHVLECSLFLFIAIAGGCASAKEQPPQIEIAMAMDPMMEQMMKLATPGPQHAELAARAGEWSPTWKPGRPALEWYRHWPGRRSGSSRRHRSRWCPAHPHC